MQISAPQEDILHLSERKEAVSVSCVFYKGFPTTLVNKMALFTYCVTEQVVVYWFYSCVLHLLHVGQNLWPSLHDCGGCQTISFHMIHTPDSSVIT